MMAGVYESHLSDAPASNDLSLLQHFCIHRYY